MTKTLATVGVLTLTGFLLMGCSSEQQKGHPETTQMAEQQEIYTCPMHPSVVSDRPGACPVCGMALVRKTVQHKIESGTMKAIRRVTLSPTQRVLANISTVHVERRTLTKEMSAVGIIEIAEPLQATVAARFRGRMEKLFVNTTGATVKQGQPLFELYSPDLLSAEQEFLLVFEAMTRAEAAGDSQTVAGQSPLLRAIRNRLRVHFGMLESQIEELQRTREIKSSVRFFSPIHGTVLQKNVVEGQYVDEGMVLYQVADLSRVWAYFDVYEQDVRYLQVGQSIQMTTEAYPGERFAGRVTFIDPVISEETRTARVRTELSNPFDKLKPKMFVTAHWQVPIVRALVVPISAVLFTGKRTLVWVEVSENTFEPREISVGTSAQGYYVVLNGLKEGDVIAATGGYLLDSESTLQQPTSADPHAGHAGEQ
jgi:Cu(I)/Ag(I) efflux system membrane fusion protein